MGAGREAHRIRVRYRAADGSRVDTTLDRVVVEEVVEGLPVRECRSFRGRKHYAGWYFSTTMGRLIAYESRLELSRVLLADFDGEVVGLIGQPLQLIGADGARIRRHVPDLLLVRGDGQVVVVDVKAKERVGEPEVRALHAWTEQVVALRGWRFEVFTGWPARRVENVRFLAGYRRVETGDTALVDPVMAVAGAEASISAVEHQLTGLPLLRLRPVILHLLWAGALQTDLDRRLGGESWVSPVAGAA